MKHLLIAACLLFTFSVKAEIVTYNFTGSAGGETVTGYFGLDTGAVPSAVDGFTGASYGLFGDDAPLVDFGVTIVSGATELVFEATRPVEVANGTTGSLGRVFNNQLVGVNGMGISQFQDTLSFSVLDLGLIASPSDPLLSTVRTGDVITYLFFARLDVRGEEGLINSNDVPAAIDFDEAITATLFVQVGSAVFDENLDRFVGLGDSRATYNLTQLSVQPVPLPLPVLLLGSALAMLAPITRIRA